MKMVLIMADAARAESIKGELATLGAPGYSAFPVLEGAGRSGVHTGDRVHPGGVEAFFVVEPDAAAERLFAEVARRRDEVQDRVTRLFLIPVEKEA